MIEIKNYAVFSWIPQTKYWNLRARFASGDLKTLAVKYASRFANGIIVDLMSGRMIWQSGRWCDRRLPVGLKIIPPIRTTTSGSLIVTNRVVGSCDEIGL